MEIHFCYKENKKIYNSTFRGLHLQRKPQKNNKEHTNKLLGKSKLNLQHSWSFLVDPVGEDTRGICHPHSRSGWNGHMFKKPRSPLQHSPFISSPLPLFPSMLAISSHHRLPNACNKNPHDYKFLRNIVVDDKLNC